MKTSLEDFIQKNKEAFDDHEPSPAIWSRIEKRMEQGPSTPGKLVGMNWRKWAIAAGLILVAGTTYFLLSRSPAGTKSPEMAISDSNKPSKNNNQNAILATVPGQFDSIEEMAQQEGPGPEKTLNENHSLPARENILSKEMYHYTKLIELRQKEISLIKKEDPELYNTFSKDLETLEYSYEVLREKQKNGINNEQLLEAMIQNLKMQTDLLNKQLEITKQIKNKKTSNEKVNSI